MIHLVIEFVKIAYNYIGIATGIAAILVLIGFIMKRIKTSRYYQYDRDVDYLSTSINLDFDTKFHGIRITESEHCLNVEMTASSYRSCCDTNSTFLTNSGFSNACMWHAINMMQDIYTNRESAWGTVIHIPVNGPVFSFDKKRDKLYYMGGTGGSSSLSNVQYYDNGGRSSFLYNVYKDTPDRLKRIDIIGAMAIANSFKAANKDQEDNDKDTDSDGVYKEYQLDVPILICSQEFFSNYDIQNGKTGFIMYIVGDGFNRCLSFYEDDDHNRMVEEVPSCVFNKIIFENMVTRKLMDGGQSFIDNVKAKRRSTYRFMKIFSCRPSKYRYSAEQEEW